MGTFCKNCGAYVDETSQFCPDCGRQVNQGAVRYCPNCGDKLVPNEYFCKNCGVKLKEPKKESFLEKYKTPVIVFSVIAVIAIITLGAVAFLNPVSDQDIRVDTIDFTIPGDYSPDDSLSVDEEENGVRYVSKFWYNSEDHIQIDVMYPTTFSVDVNDILSDVGGQKMNKMGYDGYYEKVSDDYSFTFVENNKIVTVYTSDMDVFDSIQVG